MSHIDINGMADYFSETGSFLYNDSKDDGRIRIIAEETYTTLVSISENGHSEIPLEDMISMNTCSFKSLAGSMSSESVLAVIGYYNETSVPLESRTLNGGNFSANNMGEGGSLQISVDIQKNLSGPMFDSSYNIMNAINGHENYHLQGMKQGIRQYTKNPLYQREIDAITAQKNHNTWNKTTSKFKSAIDNYLKQNMYEKEKNIH